MQPVGNPLDQYQSTCRHGTAYTVIESRYKGIATETTYFVPLGQTFEYWRLKVSNESDHPRQISVFSFCEFTNQWITFQDQVNLQYSLFIVKGELTEANMLRIASQDNLSNPGGNDGSMHTWMGLIGSPLSGYDTSREAFIGTYRGYHNPQVVEQGQCSNSNAYGDNACGTLQTNLILQPGESRGAECAAGEDDAGQGEAVGKIDRRIGRQIAGLGIEHTLQRIHPGTPCRCLVFTARQPKPGFDRVPCHSCSRQWYAAW